jgi:hypothetical protein
VIIERSEYWDHPAVSQSDLKLFDDSPFHYFAAKIAKITPPRDTVALRNGRALHALLFEPESFSDRFPRFDLELRSKDAKAQYAELQAQAEALDGCVIRDMDAVVGMASALRANRGFLKLLSLVTRAEFPVLWNCEETGVECRARLDAIGDRLVIDVKSIAKVPKRSNLEKALAEYGYAFQGSHYQAAARSIDGKEREYWLAFVESKPPYAVACYPLGSLSIEVEDKRRIALLEDLAHRRAEGRWDFQEDVLPLELPEWHMRRIA